MHRHSNFFQYFLLVSDTNEKSTHLLDAKHTVSADQTRPHYHPVFASAPIP